MGRITIDGKKIIFQRKDEVMVIEPWGNNCIRVRSTRNSRVSDEKWTVLDPTEDNAIVEGDESRATIKNGCISVSIWRGGGVTFIKMIREFSARNMKAIIKPATSTLRAITTALK